MVIQRINIAGNLTANSSTHKPVAVSPPENNDLFHYVEQPGFVPFEQMLGNTFIAENTNQDGLYRDVYTGIDIADGAPVYLTEKASGKYYIEIVPELLVGVASCIMAIYDSDETQYIEASMGFDSSTQELSCTLTVQQDETKVVGMGSPAWVQGEGLLYLLDLDVGEIRMIVGGGGMDGPNHKDVSLSFTPPSNSFLSLGIGFSFASNEPASATNTIVVNTINVTDKNKPFITGYSSWPAENT